MDESRSFGDWLRRRRRALDLTQDQLARRVGCALGTIRKLETEERRPSREVAERLAEVLELPDDERAAWVRLARASGRSTRPAAAVPGTARDPIAPVALAPPHVLRGYELREPIGAGSFGVVYRAVQPALAREVAVKVIRPELADLPAFVRRFDVEAQRIARLEHPHIVPLYDYWREPGAAYLVMRWLRGGSLTATLLEGPLPRDRVVGLLEQLAAALALAHRHGVIHGDLKPANILLDEDGNAYLSDFGIGYDAQQVRSGDARLVPVSPYAAPEQLAGEPLTPQTDIFSLGVLLAEVLAGERPPAGPGAAAPREYGAALPASARSARRDDLPPTVERVIWRATAPQPLDRYRDAQALVLDLHHALLSTATVADYTGRHGADTTERSGYKTQLGAAMGVAPAAEPARALENPFKGLRAFEEADAPDFFGREALIAQLLERLTDDSPAGRFLAVVGASGSGKSSVVRAGLLPALRRGRLPGSERWFVTQCMPGARPLEELEAALLRVAVNPPSSLLSQLEEDTSGLRRAVKRVLPDDGTTELLLLLDQFEELWTLTGDEADRAHVLASLLAAVTDKHARLRVIITLRADFYDRPLQYAAFGALLRERTLAIVAMSPAELRQAIEGPAARVGLQLDADLIGEVVRDVEDQPGSLPLLQYAMTELVERCEGTSLTLSAYQAAGGVAGALARRAETLYAGCNAAQQAAARQLFLRLVTLGEGVEDTRRRVRRSELAAVGLDQEALDTVIERYGRYRLLSFDVDQASREPTVEVAHEALLGAWRRLSDWIAERREVLLLQRQLAAATAEWLRSGRDASFLASGTRLDHYAAIRQSDVALSTDEAAFLDASVDARSAHATRERERHHRELQLAHRTARAQRLALAGMAVFLLVTTTLAAVAVRSRSAAITSYNQSESQRLAAEANGALQRGDSPELAALLALRGLGAAYSPQADAALQRAARVDFGRQIFSATNYLFRVAVSPDGTLGLVGSNDGTARLWQLETGKQLRVLSGHASSVIEVAFSPDGRLALTGSDDATLLWEVAGGQVLRSFPGGDNLGFSADGTTVLICCQAQQTGLWDARTGQQVLQVRDLPASLAVSAALAPDGHAILIGFEDATARLWDADSGQEVRTLRGHAGSVRSVAFTPDSRQAVTGGVDTTLRLWDLATGEELRRFEGHTEWIFDVAVSPDGQSVLSGSLDTTARLWDLETGKELRRLTGHTATVYGVAFAADSRSVLTSGSTDKTVRLWDLQASAAPGSFTAAPGYMFAVLFAPDGRAVLTAHADGTTRLWDAGSGQEQRRFTDLASVGAAAGFTPDQQHLLTGGFDGLTRLWRLDTGAPVRTFTGTGQVLSIAVSADGRWLLTGYDESTELWDLMTGAHVQTFHQGGRAALSPDGRAVAITTQVGSGNDDVTVWEAATGRLLQRLPHGDGATAAAFSHDGRHLLTVARSDWNLRLWDTRTWKLVRVFTGHTQRVGDLAFSPDDRYVLSSSQDKTARLWNVATGAQVRTFPSRSGVVTSAGFSPDGRLVIVGSSDGTAQLTPTDLQTLVAEVCGRVLRDLSADEGTVYAVPETTPTCTAR